MIGCKNKNHLADLPSFKNNSNERIILLTVKNPLKSTSLLHNNLPEHDELNRERVRRLLGKSCLNVEDAQLCYQSYALGLVFILSIISKDQSNSKTIIDYPNLFNSKRIYKLITYSKSLFGVLHSKGFTLLKDQKFCRTISTNPNGLFYTATSLNQEKNLKEVLVTSIGPIYKVDREVQGWKVYSLEKMCPSE